MASHLESLIYEYLEWRGYVVRRNLKIGRRARGGWEMEIDLVGYHPSTRDLVHYEPSLDAHSWETREVRFRKKFESARKYLFSEVFPWLDLKTPLRQIAIVTSRRADKTQLGGGEVLSVDEFMAEVRRSVIAAGPLGKNAISETYPLLRTLQLSHVGFNRVL
jgi:hypothetical protein